MIDSSVIKLSHCSSVHVRRRHTLTLD